MQDCSWNFKERSVTIAGMGHAATLLDFFNQCGFSIRIVLASSWLRREKIRIELDAKKHIKTCSGKGKVAQRRIRHIGGTEMK